MIHADTIEEIKNRVDIVEVIGDFVALKRAGQNYRGKSPFTNEKTPSFFVVPSKDLFKDFSSGKGGDVFAFLMEHEGMTYPESVRYLAERYGIEIKEGAGAQRNAVDHNHKSSLYVCMTFAKQYYHHQLLPSQNNVSIGLEYMQKRGFSEATIRTFELGYAPDDQGFSREALRNGHSETLLEQAGLRVKRDGRAPRDLFRNRIIFPIQDVLGKTVAFGARILAKSDNQPKYINSPETAIYHKSDVLYGLYHAKNAVRQYDNCYLVEGYTDVISMHQVGIKNVVAPLGTTLTVQQIKLIKRFTNHVTLLFDGDSAGIKATLRSIDLILKEGLDAYVVLPPDEHDPTSYLAEVGEERFNAFLNAHKKDFMAFQADLYAEEMTTNPVRKAEVVGALLHTLALVSDAIKRALYLKQMSQLFTLDESLLIATLNKNIAVAQRRDRVQQPTDKVRPVVDTPVELPVDMLDPETMVQLQEREAIRLLLNYADVELNAQKLSNFMQFELEDVVFTNPVYREIYTTFTTSWEQGTPIDSQYFFREGSESVANMVSDLLVPRYTASTNWKKKYHIAFPEEHEIMDKMAQSNVLLLKLRIVQNMGKQNREKIKAAEEQGNDDEIDDLLNHQIELDKAKQQLAALLGIVIL